MSRKILQKFLLHAVRIPLTSQITRTKHSLIYHTNHFSRLNPFRHYSSSLISQTKLIQKSRIETLEKISTSFKQWFIRSNNLHQNLINNAKKISLILSKKPWNSETENQLQNLNIKIDDTTTIYVFRCNFDTEMKIRFFEWYQQYSEQKPTIFVYRHFFKHLPRRELKRWLNDFLCNSGESDIKNLYPLVIGYVVAGKDDVAVKILNKIWSSGTRDGDFECLIRILEKEKVYGVLEYFDRFSEWNGIYNLCDSREFGKAREELERVVGISEFLNMDVALRVLGVYCRNGRVSDGLEIVDVLSEKWPTHMQEICSFFVTNLARNGKAEESRNFLTRKVAEGFVPDRHCCSWLLEGLLKGGNFNGFYQLLNLMKDKDVVLNQRVMNAAVQFFCTGKFLDVAMSFYHERKEIGIVVDAFTYKKLVTALCGVGKLEEASEVLNDGISAGHCIIKPALFILARALLNVGKVDLSVNLFDIAAATDCPPNTPLANAIVRSLCEAGKVDDAYGFLKKLKKNRAVPSRRIYSLVIEGFCDTRRVEMAYNLLMEMQHHGHAPGDFILKYVFCILCEVGHTELALNLINSHMYGHPVDVKLYNRFIKIINGSGRPDIAIQVMERMMEENHTPNLKSYVSLLYGFLISKSVVNAMNLFRELLVEKRILRSLYNVMVCGLCKIPKSDLALMYYQEMLGKRLQPSRACYVNLIRVLCVEGQFNLALELVGELKNKKYELRTYDYNVLLYYSFKISEVNHAWFFFTDMRNQKCPPNVTTFNILILGLSRARRLVPCLSILEEMMEECFTADIHIYNMLLRSLCKEREIELASDLFNRMPKKGCVRNVDSYNSLIEGLCRARRFADAKRMMSEMLEKGMQPARRIISFFRRASISLDSPSY